MDVGVPNCTLYLQNLNERVSLPCLKEQLGKIFSQHGQVLEVHAKRRLAMRGQAFVVFSQQSEATAALNSLQGVRLWGKSTVIRYARFKSNVISERDGCLQQEKTKQAEWQAERARHPRLTRRQQMAMSSTNAMSPPPVMPVVAGGGSVEVQVPAKILFLQGIPLSLATESQLGSIFGRFSGFLEIRLVPNRPEVAFVEYETEQQANVARQAMDRAELVPGAANSFRVTFARR